uniref:HAP1 N-terminal domain-containing protein n=1 Tax=Syphacia muris TaxID=451379 RepID=A0A0N5AP24_9BILA
MKNFVFYANGLSFVADTNMKLYVDESPTKTQELLSENEELRQRLKESERSNQELAVKLEESAKNAYLAEQQLIRALEIFKNQLAYQGSKIRELTDALRERTENLSDLVTQVRAGSYCLADSNCANDRIISKPSVHLMRVSSVPGSRVQNERPLKPGLVRSISVTYPGGRPNVVVQKYRYTPDNPRSRHLPSLFSTSVVTNGANLSIEKSSSSSSSSKIEQTVMSQSNRKTD